MATVIEILDFLAPGLKSSPEEKATAIEMAEAYRPKCLVKAKADEAVALYAAWLLYGREQSQAASDDGELVPVGVKSQTDGDLSRTYLTAAEAAGGIIDPAGYFGRYKALADICARMGSITVGNGFPRGCC